MLAMLLNSTTVLVGERVVLVPYRAEHVAVSYTHLTLPTKA